jgi:hypothetical protein
MAAEVKKIDFAHSRPTRLSSYDRSCKHWPRQYFVSELAATLTDSSLPLSNSRDTQTLHSFASHSDPEFHRYTDGEIVREGPEGDQGDGAYSVGVSSPWLWFIEESKLYHSGHNGQLTFFKRGGKGNIGSPKVKPAHHGADIDVIPETATKLAEQHSHHTGRGGGKLHLLRLFVYADG